MKFKSFLEVVTTNWQIKVICFCIALFITLLHQLLLLDKKYVSVPLSVYAEGQLLPGSSYPRFVRVSIRGMSTDINALAETNLKAFIDLNYYTEPGTYDVPIQIQLQSSSIDIDPLELQVEPPTVLLTLEERIIKSVPILPSFSGEPAKGFEISGYSSLPSTVEIVGPQSIIDKVSDIQSDFISVSGKSEGFAITVPLINRNTLISLQSISTAQFTVDITARVATRQYNMTAATYIGLQPDLLIVEQKTPISITLIGAMNNIEAYDLPIYAVQVDCSEITQAGEYEVPVAVYVPDGFSVLHIQPQNIIISVAEK